MTTRKQIWDKLDELEGKKKGSSYKNLMKEIRLQKIPYKKQALVKKIVTMDAIKFMKRRKS